MFRLLPTTKSKRQQIAILIISFFAYVAGIRNENNNMLLQQQQQQQSYHVTIPNTNYKSRVDPLNDIKQQTHSNFRPSPIIDFTTADATAPHQFKPTYMDAKYPNTKTVATFNANTLQQTQEKPNDNRRYTKTTYGDGAAEKPFTFVSNEQQQQLTDRPIYIYRDPYTNENYHYKPTEPITTHDTATTTPSITYNHNNYNGNGFKQQENNHQHDNQEYLVQSSMIVGTQQQQPQQQQQQQHQHHPYMSLSNDKDVYLKYPGVVYDEHPNLVTIDKKSTEVQTVKANKISYDSHDYPPPSYFQQQTSNFLPTPLPEVAKPKPTPRPVTRPTPPPKLDYRPTTTASSFLPQLFGHQQQQYLQSSQSTLPNYANNLDNYLSNKQQFDYHRTESPPHTYLQQQQRYETIPSYGSHYQQEYESRPPSPSYAQQYETAPPLYQQQQQLQQQYESRPPFIYEQYQQQQQQYEDRPPTSHNQDFTQQIYYPQQQTSSQLSPGRPSYNNYYGYQIGEVPPQTSLPSSQNYNYPYARPPTAQYPQQGLYRPPPPPQQQSGLATLAQYAPQFTSLLLGGGGGGTSSNTNSPLGSLIGALTGATTSQQPSYTSSPSSSSSSYNRRPVNSQLIKALENIARNDDLQCVPKVLCQMIAAQTQRGQLPTFITSPAITNFLAGFPAASPALIYGRGALLGLSGGEKSCHQTYEKCPKNELEIIYYLNNHRGGFFKFFSEPEEQEQSGNNDATQPGGSSLFSILAALTGSPAVTTTTPRPKPKPQPTSPDITGGIGNFFTQLLSDYMGSATVEYQRRRKRRIRRSLDTVVFEEENNKDFVKFEEESNTDNEDDGEDFNDEEDNEDTKEGMKFKDEDENENENNFELGTEGRILHKPGEKGQHVKFFPEIKETYNENENENYQELTSIIKKFNDFNKGRKFKFPQTTDDNTNDGLRQGKDLFDSPFQEQNYGYQYTNYVQESYDPLEHKDSQKVKFQDDKEEPQEKLYTYYQQIPELSKDDKTNVVFRERMGKILNYPDYAAAYTYNTEQNDKFILPNTQRPSRLTEFPQTNVHNTHINSIHSQNSVSLSSSVNNNNIYSLHSQPNTNSNKQYFLPTLPPDTDDTSSNFIFANTNDYNNNEPNYISQSESIYTKPPARYPSATSSSSSHNFYKPQRYYGSSSGSSSIKNRYPSNHYTDRYHSSLYTTRRPFTTTTKKPDDKNIYITNSRGETEYYLTPDGRKIYL